MIIGISFNQVITAKNTPDTNISESCEIKINLFGDQEYSLSVTKNTLNEIERIINKTSDKLAQSSRYSHGMPIILDAVKSLERLGLFPNNNYKNI